MKNDYFYRIISTIKDPKYILGVISGACLFVGAFLQHLFPSYYLIAAVLFIWGVFALIYNKKV